MTSLGRNLSVVPFVIYSLSTLGRADYLCKKVVEQCVNNASDDYQTCEPFKFTVKGNNNYVKVAPFILTVPIYDHLSGNFLLMQQEVFVQNM